MNAFKPPSHQPMYPSSSNMSSLGVTKFITCECMFGNVVSCLATSPSHASPFTLYTSSLSHPHAPSSLIHMHPPPSLTCTLLPHSHALPPSFTCTLPPHSHHHPPSPYHHPPSFTCTLPPHSHHHPPPSLISPPSLTCTLLPHAYHHPPSFTCTLLPHSHARSSLTHIHPSPSLILTLLFSHLSSSLTHNTFSPPPPHTHTRTQELVDHYQRDMDGLAQRLSIPCPRFNQPATVGLSYRYIAMATQQ